MIHGPRVTLLAAMLSLMISNCRTVLADSNSPYVTVLLPHVRAYSVACEANCIAAVQYNGDIYVFTASQTKPSLFVKQNFGAPQDIAVSDDGRYLAVTDSFEVDVWDILHRRKIQMPRTLSNSFNSIAFVGRTDLLAIAGRLTTDVSDPYLSTPEYLSLWNINSKKLMWRRVLPGFPYPSAIAVSKDGAYIAVGLGLPAIELFRPSTGKSTLIWPHRKIRGIVTALAFSQDSQQLAAGGLDGTCFSTSVYGRRKAVGWLDGSLLVSSMAFCNEGRTIAVADDSTNALDVTSDTLEFFDPSSGRMVKVFRTSRSFSPLLAMSPNQDSLYYQNAALSLVVARNIRTLFGLQLNNAARPK